MTHPNREELAGRCGRDAAYWRKAYEDLVDQTGRDLNDGLGRDPRREGRYATSGRAAAALRQSPTVEEVARVIEPSAFEDGRWHSARKQQKAFQKDALAKAQAIADLYGRGG
jgi:hypothetical protein